MQDSSSAAPVFHNRDAIAFLDDGAIEDLKRSARESVLGRARICLHHSPEDPVQEMILAVTERSCFPAHRHRDKVESFVMLEGRLALLILADDGSLIRREILAPLGQGGHPVFRMAVMAWHAVLPLDEMVVYQEVTTGPFVPGATEWAGFCPTEGNALRSFLRARAGLS